MTDASRSPEPMIRLESLTKRYPGQAVPAVDGITLDIPKGEIVVLVGPSGCGKTTVLKMINRLIEPTSGRVLIGAEDVTGLTPTSCGATSATSSSRSACSPT